MPSVRVTLRGLTVLDTGRSAQWNGGSESVGPELLRKLGSFKRYSKFD